MQYITFATNVLSLLLFCGFMAVFILPKLFFWLFYTIPQIIRFSITKKMRFRAIAPILNRIGAWVAIILGLYGIAFLLDANTGRELLTGTTAQISWFVSAGIVLSTIFFNREGIQNEFYKDIYLKYICSDEKKRYDQSIEEVGRYTMQKVLEEEHKHLPYLHKAAIRNRKEFLHNENRKAIQLLRAEEK